MNMIDSGRGDRMTLVDNVNPQSDQPIINNEGSPIHENGDHKMMDTTCGSTNMPPQGVIVQNPTSIPNPISGYKRMHKR